MEPVKIVLLGDGGVGKTSIVTRYSTGVVPSTIKPTVGAAFVTKEIQIDGIDFELLIWDTAGQEAYRGLAPMYYRSAAIAIIVFDVSRPSTYDSVSYWINEIKNNSESRPVLVVCANKVDSDENKFNSTQAAEIFAKDNNAIFIETSALTGLGIDRLFQTSVAKFYKENPVAPATKVLPKSLEPPEQERKKGCC